MPFTILNIAKHKKSWQEIANFLTLVLLHRMPNY